MSQYVLMPGSFVRDRVEFTGRAPTPRRPAHSIVALPSPGPHTPYPSTTHAAAYSSQRPDAPGASTSPSSSNTPSGPYRPLHTVPLSHHRAAAPTNPTPRAASQCTPRTISAAAGLSRQIEKELQAPGAQSVLPASVRVRAATLFVGTGGYRGLRALAAVLSFLAMPRFLPRRSSGIERTRQVNLYFSVPVPERASRSWGPYLPDTPQASLMHRLRPQARIRDELSVQRSGPASRVPSTAAASKLQHTNDRCCEAAEKTVHIARA